MPFDTDQPALSLSNLSPYGEEAMSRKKRPELPRFSSHAADESDSELSEDTLSTPSTGITTPAEPVDQTTAPEPDEPSDEQKLAAVIEEFGDIASLMERDDGEGSEPERLLAESKGSLFK
jgi:sterol 3beta-glucosyltransferase